MIALLLFWIIVIFVFYTFGSLFIRLYGKISKSTESYSFFETFLLGLVITTALISIISLFIPSDTFLLCVFLLLALLMALSGRKYIYDKIIVEFNRIRSRKTSMYWFYCSSIFLIILFLSLVAPLWVDVGYYHIQNIMWNEEYAVIPGLANLQPRFGFNSNLFLLYPTFGLKPLFGQYIFGLHGIVLFLMFIWILNNIYSTCSLPKAIISLVVYCCIFIVYKLHITSSSTDFLPNFLIVFLLLKVIFSENSIKDNPLLFVIIPVFCITLKLSSFLICLLIIPVFYYFKSERKHKELLAMIVISCLIVFPWIIRTVIITGYLVFPFPAVDIFNFDWKIPVQYVQDHKHFIEAFAKNDKMPMQQVLNLSLFEWVPMWWNSGMFYHTALVNRIFAVLIPLSVCLMIVMVGRAYTRKQFPLYMFWVVSFVGVVFWFLNAPDFRFAYGFILSLVFIPFYILLNQFSSVYLKLTKPIIIKCLHVTLCLSLIFLFVQSGRWIYYKLDYTEPVSLILIKPQGLSVVKKNHEKEFKIEIDYHSDYEGNIFLNKPLGWAYCYDFPLPCGIEYVGGIEMRGNNFQQGFRAKENCPHRKTY